MNISGDCQAFKLAGKLQIVSNNPLQIYRCRRIARMTMYLTEYNRYGLRIILVKAINLFCINKEQPATLMVGVLIES